ncbi:MAG TPA: lysophospholipid acyltransferase family protein [Nitrospirota bacterium]|nr:lysophospholipid acyltransferase family protein [Nitrospirota bacterium]
MTNISLRTFLHPRYWYAWPVLAFVRVSSWLPSRMLWILGITLGSFFSWFQSPARRVAERNIELCFPETGRQERRKLLRRHFRLSGFAVLSLSVAWWAPKWRLRRFIKLRNIHLLHEPYKAGKNAILLTPHFLGLDIGAARLALEGDFVSMYRRSRNPFLEYLFRRRSRFGDVVVERSSSLKTLIKYIRGGRPFYYLPDQDMGERASVFVPFLGVPAATVTALSRIAQSTNAVVLPCITRILPRGRGYEICLYPSLDNFPTEDPLADAKRMNEEVEKWVREMPEQYLWSYRRFKTRPNNEPSLYDKA